ncbi:MAG: outer membrane lipoprotein carrier protein LolA [Desulfobulbus sp.]|uniref:outer membrane lipoprotein carrier protein LolA n=1 Tax=Desulfobulbus sp. TaxID=895 RepID=UPI00283C2026|nr:outer membrane lipoprotein carrier protein LolA [Desulfobulbus sp.]MDR2548911.1 outer membrane lipoprotein carrier protein LolA [Desulfobulbus sp.]
MSVRLVWCLVLSLLLGAAVARGDDTGAASTRLRSVQADFTQEKHLKILARPLISQGTLAFQAPGSLRWEYLRPIHTVLLLHDGRIDKLIERDGRFERDNGAGVDAMRTVLQDIGSWLDGRFSDNPLFAVNRTGAQTLVLTPKEPGLETVIKRIELRLGAQEGVVDRIAIVEGDAAVTVLTFSGVVLNRDIPAQRFATP